MVWVVIHCEYFARTSDPKDGAFIDEMVFHVAGSVAAAERYVRKHHGMPHSWWMVQRRLVDERDCAADDQPETHFYNFRGVSRKQPPHESALRAFEKLQRERQQGK